MKVMEIAFVGYPVTDLQRARQFYEGVLGLKPTSIFGDDKQAWIEYDIGPNTLAIGNGAPDWKPNAGGGSVALEVDDFPAMINHLKQHKIRFVLEPIESPVCHMAAVSDPDGNSVTIHKRKS
jgi:catechol 2,3-dioxygenase-like lactoylglutathione lyase family enzyme